MGLRAGKVGEVRAEPRERSHPPPLPPHSAPRKGTLAAAGLTREPSEAAADPAAPPSASPSLPARSAARPREFAGRARAPGERSRRVTAPGSHLSSASGGGFGWAGGGSRRLRERPEPVLRPFVPVQEPPAFPERAQRTEDTAPGRAPWPRPRGTLFPLGLPLRRPGDPTWEEGTGSGA